MLGLTVGCLDGLSDAWIGCRMLRLTVVRKYDANLLLTLEARPPVWRRVPQSGGTSPSLEARPPVWGHVNQSGGTSNSLEARPLVQKQVPSVWKRVPQPGGTSPKSEGTSPGPLGLLGHLGLPGSIRAQAASRGPAPKSPMSPG